jgi:hypothetical protein
MKILSIFVLTVGLVGCYGPESVLTDAGTVCPSKDAAMPPDLSTPVRCAAAKGLGGDILSDLCLDMDKIDTQGLMTRGFDLMAATTRCGGWEIASNKLQPKGITNMTQSATCTLQLPPIAVDPKYSRVTLAIAHQAGLPVADQQAMIALPGAMPKPLWVWITSTTTVEQRTIIEIPRSKISPPNGTPFAPIIQLYTPAAPLAPTWTIDSIAVLGNQ